MRLDGFLAGTRTEGRNGNNLSYRGFFDYNADRYGVQAERLVVEVGVEVALVAEVADHPLGTPRGPVVGGEEDVGVGAEGDHEPRALDVVSRQRRSARVEREPPVCAPAFSPRNWRS